MRIERVLRLFTDRSILAKLIISLFVIVTPLYAFNYVINNIAADKNRMEIERALTNSVHSYTNILDGEFQRIQQMLDTSTLDIVISLVDLMKPDLADISPNEKSVFFNQVREHLARIQYSTRFITDTEAHMPVLGTTLSVVTPGIREIDEDQFDAMGSPGQSFVPWDGQLYMNTPFITHTKDNGKGLFILAVKLSRETISSYLSKIMSFERGGALLFDRQNVWEISTRGSTPITAAIKQHLMEENDGPARPPSGPRILTADIEGEPYLIVYEPSSHSDALLAAYAPESEIYESLDIYHDFFYSMSALSALIIVLFALGLYKVIHQPLRTLVQAFRRVEIGQLHFKLFHKNRDEFGYLYTRFNNMIETLDNMVNVVYEQKLLSERAELKRLQAQINPHFLYNNFFVLQRLIRAGQRDKASQFSEYLGRYFQFVTRNADDEIRLEEDALHARTYVDIQSVCFDHRVTISFAPIPAEIADVLVPRLIIQPLIENSFNHVFENRLTDGALSVTFAADEQSIRVIVDDNGGPLEDSMLDTLVRKLAEADKNLGESTGMINVHRRLRLKFGGESGLHLSRSPLGGLRAQIVIERSVDA